MGGILSSGMEATMNKQFEKQAEMQKVMVRFSVQQLIIWVYSHYRNLSWISLDQDILDFVIVPEKRTLFHVCVFS